MRLNGWQRLWVVVSVITLGLTLGVVGLIWPERDDRVLSDLRSPACKAWRELPSGFVPDTPPEWREECYSLRSVLYYQKINLSSEEDYRRYLVRARVKTVFLALSSWVAAVVVLYVFGWSIGWVARGFSKAPKA